jgi:hypothetical protein
MMLLLHEYIETTKISTPSPNYQIIQNLAQARIASALKNRTGEVSPISCTIVYSYH